ncbi:MAG: hypothetical protein AAF684_01000 [Pseudomonadota bacterium]
MAALLAGVVLTACASTAPPAGDLPRADAEARLLEAIGLVPAISTIFDAVAERRAREGRGRSDDAQNNQILRAVIEQGKPELAEAFGREFSTTQLRAFVGFLESENGRAFGAMHARIIALFAVAAARGVADAQTDALSEAAMAAFWSEASPETRAATERFLNSPDGAAWSDGLDAALNRVLERYQALLSDFAEVLRERRMRERDAQEDGLGLRADAPDWPLGPVAAAA